MNESVEIAGVEIPTWALLAVGAGVVFLALLGRGGGGGASIAPQAVGEAIGQQVAQQLESQRTELRKALEEQSQAYSAYLSELAQWQYQAMLQQQEAQARALEQQQSMFQRLLDFLSRLPTGGGGGGGGAPSTGGGLAVPMEEIERWAKGIGFPTAVGEAFVRERGRLPQTLSEFEEWLNAKGWRDPRTGQIFWEKVPR